MGAAELRKRKAEDKAAGVVRTYPEHAAGAKRSDAEAEPCVYAKPVNGFRRAELGLVHGKEWRECTHPRKPLRGEVYVCPCDGCGLPCTEFTRSGKLGGHFNSGIVEHRGRLLLFSRKGWADADVYVTELTDRLTPKRTPMRLNLIHPQCVGGREDPRPFTFRGKLHVAFIGVLTDGYEYRTQQLVAELGEDLQPVNVWAPTYARRTWPREKNWSFFEADGELYSVYSVSPHTILRHRGTTAEEAVHVPWYPTWGGLGHLRGGAAPVRVGDEFYHFFHGMAWRESLGHTEYSIGVYTFDAKPPFAPKRGPALLMAATEDRPGWSARVVFPCGAVLRSGEWIVSYGYNDERTEFARWKADVIEAALTSPTSLVSPSLRAEIGRTQLLPGWCPQDKAESLADLVLRHKPGNVVEVGVFGGRSLLPMALAAKRVMSTVHAVDPWDLAASIEGDHGRATVEWWHACDIDSIRRQFVEAVNYHDVASAVEVLRTSGVEAAKRFADRTVGLLHIDGNHSPQVSLADVKAWLPKMAPGGFVAFDDVYWPEVKDALAELDKAGKVYRDYESWRLYRIR